MNEAIDPHCLSDEHAAGLLARAPWERVVGIGDSVIEGIREPVDGYRDESWMDRLVRILRLVRPTLDHLNLGRRGLLAAQVRESQLARALEFRPDLAVVAFGGNDTFGRDFDEAGVAAELEAVVSALRSARCQVVTIGLLDITLSGVVPEKYAKTWSTRLGRLNALTAEVASRFGAIHVDNTGHPVAADPGIYSSDGIHLNARGHAIAAAGTLRRLAAAIDAPAASRAN
ncbi:SGNH/GDSL hydrolase family protein [Sphaerisporangium perillae]|uniref:SGNH/GDSL hydrolase family protein n=1 Tax=Sphaerisporangium perillae TaxID=2935860 RepID=UPI00200C25AD|nr:SGNH/GDSL hydrolase family protein [Sphaerisporangium perillae]